MSTTVTEKQMDHIDKVLTSEQIVEIAQKITNDRSLRVLNCSLSDYSDEKMGYTASHHILKITVQKSNKNSRETLSGFVKIVNIPLPDDFVQNIDLNDWISDRETFFLSTVASEFKESYKSEKLWPMHYYTTKNVMVLEDLKSKGYKVLEEFVDNQMMLKSVLASLARFHACSILTESRFSEKSKHPVALSEHYKDKFPELSFLLSGDGAVWYQTVIKLNCSLAEHLGYDPTKIRKLFESVCDTVKPSEIHRNAICHGDVHCKNLMFADGSPLPKCALVDFQTYRYAPLVTDILQFLHINTLAKFREKHEASLIEYYYSILSETVKSNVLTKRAGLPTLEDIFKGIKDLRLFGLVIACIYYPITYIDPELMKKNSRNDEFNKNLFSVERHEFTLQHMKVNEVYKNNVEEAFHELVERSNYHSL